LETNYLGKCILYETREILEEEQSFPRAREMGLGRGEREALV
jgi:hypothetical protein